MAHVVLCLVSAVGIPMPCFAPVPTHIPILTPLAVSKQGEAQAPQRQGAVKATYARTHARPTPQARPLVREPAVGGTRRAAAGVRGVRGRAGAVPMARVGL